MCTVAEFNEVNTVVAGPHFVIYSFLGPGFAFSAVSDYLTSMFSVNITL